MSYERPSIARPRSPQGHWGGKSIAKPVPTVAPVAAAKKQHAYDLSLQCDEEFRTLPKTSTNKASRSVEEIEAEIKETQEELDKQENSDSWADACDTDDLEEKIEELDEELEAARLQLKEQKDHLGRPCADDSAW